MKPRLLIATFAALLLMLVPSLVAADETLSPQALEIANALNCPVCQGESVRDSQSSIAVEMRQVIQQKLDQGQSQQQIMDYFVERYGVSILREPPRQGFFHTLWWMPVVGFLVGALILAVFLSHRQGQVAEDPADLDELQRYEDLIGQELISDGGAG